MTRNISAYFKVPSHESYTQRCASPRACLHREEMRNGGISSSEVSRPVSRVVTLLTLTRACIGRTSSDAPHSVPFWRVFTSRSFMKYGKVRQTVRGIGRGAADTRPSKGKKYYNTGNRAGYFHAKCYLETLQLEYFGDFQTFGTPQKGIHCALFKISKSSFLFL